ncbi:hypothetical protein AA0313_1829 [Acetobacter indonesiensis NRIC 0313]|uniref:Uncharacterized protein n=1 Tax=Acetobacter indonesiensis TaxID=104101 RepID=A0ABQ0KC72_9PROT|nr:hypothetical protein [Acetobacter indonesiensis]GAN64715.1 hypothetical protein Abin_213_001 [Acetobacter indonesiensis]GBQ58560.1 hypothetical protein AA0313_1829 [Acetobacter indonesiensis NRIC 0313]
MNDSIALAAVLAREFEGPSLRPYVCPAGYWTIGYEVRFDALVLEESDRLEELAAIPAFTPQGPRLKAEIILALLPEHLRYSEVDAETQLMLSLERFH